MTTYQNDTEDWKEWHKEGQERKARNRVELSELVERFCVNNSIYLEKKTPYQFRLSKSMFDRVDVFPTTSKVHILKQGSKYQIVDLYRWLKKYYGA